MLKTDPMPLPTPKRVLEKTVAMRRAGKSLAVIAKQKGVTPEAVSYRLKRAGFVLEERLCALPDCKKAFQPRSLNGKYCSHRHAVLGSVRAQNRTKVVRVECKLPECRVLVWRRGARNQYCSREHCDLNQRRRDADVYARLVDGEPKCLVCGEFFVTDVHHTEHHKGKSNKAGPVVTLCPTHHMMVHRGLAKVEKGHFVSLVPEILRGLKRKLGPNWNAAKK